MLTIAAELTSFELDAELDDAGRPHAFFYATGGPGELDGLLDEPPTPRVEHGPFTWPEVLESQLRPNRWLELFPAFVHPSILELVERDLPSASAEARKRWSKKLQDARRRRDIERPPLAR